MDKNVKSTATIHGRVLVKGNIARNNYGNDERILPETTTEIKDDKNSHNKSHPHLHSTIGLSFWGGIDPQTGIVIDHTHPLYNECVADKILSIPSGRGSCTGSQVLLELILNGKAPKCIILRDIDCILCTGAIVAREVFGREEENEGGKRINVPLIISLGRDGFDELSLAMENGVGPYASVAQIKSSLAKEETEEDNDVLSGAFVILGNSQEVIEHKTNEVIAKSSYISPEGTLIDDTPAPTSSLSPAVNLTPKEYSILHGKDGATKAQQIAMRTIYQIAQITSSTRLLPITQSHIDGCTYIGPGGLQFVKILKEKGGKVSVPTTLNSVSADRRRWLTLGVDESHAIPSNALGDAYLALGCTFDSFTCAPYLLGEETIPKKGENIAWGESNAVVYANSMIGAKTEKYADYFDICAAIAGCVPALGVHLDENRKAGVILDATDMIRCHVIPSLEQKKKKNKDEGYTDHHCDDDDDDGLDAFFATLGYVCGNLSDGKIPLLLGVDQIPKDKVSNDYMKAFCAAFGTTGAAPLIHVAGVTAEAMDKAYVKAMIDDLVEEDKKEVKENKNDKTQQKKENIVVLTQDHMLKAFEALNGGADTITSLSNSEFDVRGEKIDLVALGNPHLSLAECARLAKLVTPSSTTARDNRITKESPGPPNAITNASEQITVWPKHPDIKIMATLSRHVYNQATKLGYVHQLKQFGVQFINDTCWCMILDPPIIPPSKDAVTMTNSGKYAHYGPGLTNRNVRFGSMSQCILTARSGYLVRGSKVMKANGSMNTSEVVRDGGIYSGMTWLGATRGFANHSWNFLPRKGFFTLVRSLPKLMSGHIIK